MSAIALDAARIAIVELFQSFEKLATKCLERESDEIARQFGAAAPAIALDIAKTLHFINSLAVDDTVPMVISRRSPLAWN